MPAIVLVPMSIMGFQAFVAAQKLEAKYKDLDARLATLEAERGEAARNGRPNLDRRPPA
jgi:hypothetical protein